MCSDQDAVDLVRDIHEPAAAAKVLVDHALQRFSTDNLSCMIIRFDKQGAIETQTNRNSAIGVEGDASAMGKVSEVEKIIGATKQKIAEGDVPAVGVSASNSGLGHDPVLPEGTETPFTPTIIKGSVEEEPASIS